MTERRPHWDDDLIDAVRDGMSTEMVAAIGGKTVTTSTYIPSDDDVFNVIAAVEDWHLAQETHSPLDVMGTLVEAEHSAAIQRVQDALTLDHIGNMSEDWWDGYTSATEDVLRALDGPR